MLQRNGERVKRRLQELEMKVGAYEIGGKLPGVQQSLSSKVPQHADLSLQVDTSAPDSIITSGVPSIMDLSRPASRRDECVSKFEDNANLSTDGIGPRQSLSRCNIQECLPPLQEDIAKFTSMASATDSPAHHQSLAFDDFPGSYNASWLRSLGHSAEQSPFHTPSTKSEILCPGGNNSAMPELPSAQFEDQRNAQPPVHLHLERCDGSHGESKTPFRPVRPTDDNLYPRLVQTTSSLPAETVTRNRMEHDSCPPLGFRRVMDSHQGGTRDLLRWSLAHKPMEDALHLELMGTDCSLMERLLKFFDVEYGSTSATLQETLQSRGRTVQERVPNWVIILVKLMKDAGLEQETNKEGIMMAVTVLLQLFGRVSKDQLIEFISHCLDH
ncbi:hypothetical protein ACCO45_009846 [Purpureocillium lilacinum]|uniref:Uncharacterized protein n=1 Tax=Purpureocillium lilacinum TaxID=33203 RepID=A0ACC4DI64_PURLI